MIMLHWSIILQGKNLQKTLAKQNCAPQLIFHVNNHPYKHAWQNETNVLTIHQKSFFQIAKFMRKTKFGIISQSF